MWKRNLTYAVALAVAAGGAGVASALAQQSDSDTFEDTKVGFFGHFKGHEHMMHERMLSDKADVLGMTKDEKDELEAAWENGQSWEDISAPTGLSEDEFHIKMQALRRNEMRSYLSELATKGVITPAEADKRWAAIEEHLDNFSSRRHFFGSRGPRAPNWQEQAYP